MYESRCNIRIAQRDFQYSYISSTMLHGRQARKYKIRMMLKLDVRVYCTGSEPHCPWFASGTCSTNLPFSPAGGAFPLLSELKKPLFLPLPPSAVELSCPRLDGGTGRSSSSTSSGGGDAEALPMWGLLDGSAAASTASCSAWASFCSGLGRARHRLKLKKLIGLSFLPEEQEEE